MSGSSCRPTVLVGRVITPDGVLEHGHVSFDGSRIRDVGAGPGASTGSDVETITLAPGRTVLPGLVDSHCHGGGGGEFGADRASGLRAARFHHRSGTTSVVASLVSASVATLEDGVRACADLVAAGEVVAVHLEGPFLSPARAGAQDPSSLAEIDLGVLDRLLAASPGVIRCVTFAPELPGSIELVHRLVAADVIAAIGHTDATGDQTRRVIDEIVTAGGRALATHLFNAMAPIHHRAAGPVVPLLEAAAAGRAHVELIGDGTHLEPQIVRYAMGTAGPGGVVLVSDAMSAAGQPAGRYRLGDVEVVVDHGEARMSGSGALAGSASTLADVLAWTVMVAGVELVDAVRAASAVPARLLGIDEEVGELAAGRRADLLVVDETLRVEAVWRRGERIA